MRQGYLAENIVSILPDVKWHPLINWVMQNYIIPLGHYWITKYILLHNLLYI